MRPPLLPRVLALLLVTVSVPQGVRAVEDAEEEDVVFWSDPRGIILPITEGELDLVRLGELREQYEVGLEHLDAGRWDEAVEILEVVAAEIPVAEVLLTAAVAHFQLEHYGRCEELLGLALATAAEDVRCNNLMGLALSAQGRPTEAQPYLLICRERAQASGNDAFEAYAMLNLAQIELDLGHPGRAEELAQGALDVGKKRRYGNVTAASHNTLGNVALYRGEMKAAEKHYRRSSGVERRGRGNEDRAAVLNNLANVLAARGDLEGARDLLLEAVEASRETGRSTQEGGILVTLAGIEHQLGHDEAVDPMLEEALGLFRRLELERGVAEVRLQEARVARGRHRTPEALEAIELGRLALRDLTLPRIEAELDLLEAELLLDASDPTAAAGRAPAPPNWFAAAEQPALEAAAALAWAEASAATGAEEDAATAFEQALAALQGADDDARLADAQQRYGLFLLHRGELERGGTLVDSSLRWMEDAGMVGLAARTHNQAGAALVDVGAPEPALGRFEAGQAAGARAGDAQLEELCRANRIRVLAQLGRWDEAQEIAGPDAPEEILALVGSGRARGAYQDGVDAMGREDWPSAVQALERALDLAPAADEDLRKTAHSTLRRLFHFQGQEAHENGDFPTAADHYGAAFEHVGFEEDPVAEGDLLKDMGMLKFDLEDVAASLGFLEQALAAAEASGDERLMRTVRFDLGLVAMESDPTRARSELEASLAVIEGASDELAAATRYNLGVLLYREGERDASRGMMEAAQGLYLALGMDTNAQQIQGYLDEFEDMERP